VDAAALTSMQPAVQPSSKRIAVAVLLCAQLSACSPHAFDDLVEGAQGEDAGHAGRKEGKDAASRSPRDDAGPDTAPAASEEGGAMHEGGALREDGAVGEDGSVAGRAGSDGSAAALDGGTSGADAALDAAGSECPHAADTAGVRLSTTDLGVVPIPLFVSSRALLGSAALGDRVAWLFSVPGDRYMVAWGNAGEPPLPPSQLNEQGPFVSVLPAEASPNGGAVGVTSVVAASADEALIFYTSTAFLAPTAVGVARLQRDQPQAEVVRALDLFPPAPEPAPGKTPWRPLFYTGAVTEQTAGGTLLYVYSCNPNFNNQEETSAGILSAPCRVARVPLEDMSHHMAYRHWDGNDWVEDPLQAAVVLTGVTGGITVSFNRYLGQYLAVHSGTADNVLLRIAPAPQGPWHTLGSFGTLPGGGPFETSLSGAEHAALKDACERVLHVSYTRVLESTDESGAKVTRSETRMVRVELD
jgi:hypothetical protein